MTVMKTALNEGGIKLPLNRRIWLWLKDHPSHTGSEVGSALNEPQSNVANALNDLVSRQMCSFSSELEKDSRGYVRPIKRFSALGREFELLPKAKSGEKRPPAKKYANTPTPEEPIKVIALPEKAKPALATKDWMESYKLGELRSMYEDLKKLFGG